MKCYFLVLTYIVISSTTVLGIRTNNRWISYIQPENNDEATSFKDICGLENSGKFKIFNGRVARKNQYPWLAFIALDGTYKCGGSILSPYYILTAAHCIDGYSKFYVLLGSHDIMEKKEPGRQIFMSQEYSIHPEYSKKPQFVNDIGLIKLPKPATFNEFVRPACLPSKSENNIDAYFDKRTVIAGWGKTNNGNELVLHHGRRIPVISHASCKKTFSHILDTAVCTSSRSKLPTTCYGDSGGPLNMRVGKRFVIIGVSSFLRENCTDGLPHGFSRISAYLDWISTETGLDVD